MTPNWDLITAGSWGGRWDLSVGSMSVTKTREKVVDFVDPYYYDFGMVAVPKDSTVQKLEELAGKEFCVGASTTYEQWLNGHARDRRPEHAAGPADVKVTTLADRQRVHPGDRRRPQVRRASPPTRTAWPTP